MEILNVENLSFSYPSCDKPALQNISFSLNRGDFAVICGATGSGKSTLLRLLKAQLAPNGTKEGKVSLFGREASSLSERESAFKIGYVMQQPEQQIVTDKVWHELAFGLESMGLPNDTIRRRVAETACYFGIDGWFDKSTAELSGGQKQLLNLAAVMIMQPDILLLDEPTAQLDPIAASAFIDTVSRLNRELSLTVLICEHRLEQPLANASLLLALKDGRIIANSSVRNALKQLCAYPEMLPGLPAAVQLYSRLCVDAPCPLTVREGSEFIQSGFKNDIKSLPEQQYTHSDKSALELSQVFLRYSKEQPDVLSGLSLTVYENELFCVLGDNGSGKTTMLSAAAALLKPYSGSIKVFGKSVFAYSGQSLYQDCLALLPQDVQTVFLHDTLRQELEGADIDSLPFTAELTALLDMHPYDLSGGQQQLAALARVLATKPRLLLLDEPTKGLDAHTKSELTGVLRRLRDDGMTIIAVTHDVDFAAECADRCAMFFRGELVSCDTPRRFFPDNRFYTTAASLMTRGYFENAITVDDAWQLCMRNAEKKT